MKKINVAGMLSLIGGLCLFGFHELSLFMSSSSNLNTFNQTKKSGGHKSLYDILHEDNFEWIESIPWGKVREGADYLVTMPLWLMLVIVGVFLLLVGGIFIKR